MIQTVTQRIFLFGIIVTLTAAAVMGIVAVIIGRLDPFWGKVFVTTLVIGSTSILGLAGATSHVLKGARPAGLLCIAVGITALLFTILDIWILPDVEWILKLMRTIWPTAIALGLSGLLALARLTRGWYRGVRWGTWAMYLFNVVFVWYIVWFGINPIIERASWITFILSVLGTVTVPILHRISTLEVASELKRKLPRQFLELVCPRCEERQQLSLGKSECATCGLKFGIEIRV